MLPVATAPAAIVFEASTMTTGYMMKAGLPMNFICILVKPFTVILFSIVKEKGRRIEI
jgi:di/tricarboxylate transporter